MQGNRCPSLHSRLSRIQYLKSPKRKPTAGGKGRQKPALTSSKSRVGTLGSQTTNSQSNPVRFLVSSSRNSRPYLQIALPRRDQPLPTAIGGYLVRVPAKTDQTKTSVKDCAIPGAITKPWVPFTEGFWVSPNWMHAPDGPQQSLDKPLFQDSWTESKALAVEGTWETAIDPLLQELCDAFPELDTTVGGSYALCYSSLLVTFVRICHKDLRANTKHDDMGTGILKLPIEAISERPKAYHWWRLQRHERTARTLIVSFHQVSVQWQAVHRVDISHAMRELYEMDRVEIGQIIHSIGRKPALTRCAADRIEASGKLLLATASTASYRQECNKTVT